MNLSSIFLGSIGADERKYLRMMLEHLKTKGYDRIFIPCVGQFGVAKAALEAGWKAEQLYCSDVSLFSSLLGNFYGWLPMETAHFELTEGWHKEEYKTLPTEVERLAHIMLLMKISQFRTSVNYENQFRDELMENRVKYRADLVTQLNKAQSIYSGINYVTADMRDIFDESKTQLTESDIVIMNPPVFAAGYTKMFAFGEFIDYVVPADEFNYGKEVEPMIQASMESKALCLWHASKKFETVDSENVIFATQWNTEKFGYWISTRLKPFADFKELYATIVKKSTDEVSHFELMRPDTELTKDSKIGVLEINKDTALYYRDLFAHRLGATVAETYFALFVDNKLMAVAGFNTSFLRRMQETYIFENFCFNISHEKYENLNRLCMQILVSGEFKRYLQQTTLKQSPYVELKTMRTVCLSKYRKMKLNNGLLRLMYPPEKLPNGIYKLMYETEYYMDRDYKKCLEIYLEKEVRLIKSKVKEETE